jgi:hypothetical protein
VMGAVCVAARHEGGKERVTNLHVPSNTNLPACICLLTRRKDVQREQYAAQQTADEGLFPLRRYQRSA